MQPLSRLGSLARKRPGLPAVVVAAFTTAVAVSAVAQPEITLAPLADWRSATAGGAAFAYAAGTAYADDRDPVNAAIGGALFGYLVAGLVRWALL
jgi:hypothetical protein